MIKIKNIYKDRLHTLKKEYKSLQKLSLKYKESFDGYMSIIKEYEKEIKDISNNENIDPNEKYIHIQEKTKYIQTVFVKIGETNSLFKDKLKRLESEKSLIINDICSYNKSSSTEEVINEVNILLK